MVAWQPRLAALALLAALGVLWRVRREARRLDGLLALQGATIAAFVTSLGPNVSLYRQAVGLVGLVPLLARLPAWLLFAIAAVLAALAPGLAEAFFDTELV